MVRLFYRPDAGDGSTGGDAGEPDVQPNAPQQQPDEKRFSQTDVDAIAAKVRTEERRKAKSEGRF